MNEQGSQTIMALARLVTQEQNCVLEVVVLEDSVVVHLIPIEIWEGEDFDE